MEYAKNNKDVILVNLSFLQNETNLLFFLKQLNSTYMNRDQTKFITKIPHTKTKESIVNRVYDIDITTFQPIIDKLKDEKIENFINNLKISSNRVNFEKKRFSVASLF